MQKKILYHLLAILAISSSQYADVQADQLYDLSYNLNPYGKKARKDRETIEKFYQKRDNMQRQIQALNVPSNVKQEVDKLLKAFFAELEEAQFYRKKINISQEIEEALHQRKAQWQEENSRIYARIKEKELADQLFKRLINFTIETNFNI